MKKTISLSLLLGAAEAQTCTIDTDCGDGMKCYRAADNDAVCIKGDALGAPAPTTCTTNADCGDGMKCYRAADRDAVCIKGDALGEVLDGCTKELLDKCRDIYKALPECTEKPAWDKTTCCPSCRKPEPTGICPRPAECAAGVKPEHDATTHCLTCIPPCDTRTDIQKETCKLKMAADDFPVCIDAPPERTTDCCLSCKPEPLSPDAGKPEAPCKCSTDYDALPVCGADTKPDFNRDTCCRTCKLRSVQPKPNAQQRCTKEQFKTCVMSRSDCEGRETPLRTKACCKSCVRPAQRCDLREVIKQCADTPACEDGQEPSRIEGSCCFTCRAKPSCATDCAADGKVCTRKGCKAKKVKKVLLRVAVAKVKRAVGKDAGNVGKEEVKALLAEVVERFCDRADDVGRDKLCDNKDAILDGLRVKLVNLIRNRKASKGERIPEGEDVADIEIDVEVPEVEASRRQLLASGDLLDAALADPEATGDIAEPAPKDGDVTSSAAAATFSFAAFCGALFL